MLTLLKMKVTTVLEPRRLEFDVDIKDEVSSENPVPENLDQPEPENPVPGNPLVQPEPVATDLESRVEESFCNVAQFPDHEPNEALGAASSPSGQRPDDSEMVPPDETADATIPSGYSVGGGGGPRVHTTPEILQKLQPNNDFKFLLNANDRRFVIKCNKVSDKFFTYTICKQILFEIISP